MPLPECLRVWRAHMPVNGTALPGAGLHTCRERVVAKFSQKEGAVLAGSCLEQA